MVVRMRHTKGKTKRRRANVGVAVPAITMEDGVPHLRHRANRVTGMYRGKKVLDVTKSLKKKSTKEEKEE